MERNFDIINKVYENMKKGLVYRDSNDFLKMWISEDERYVHYYGFGHFCHTNNTLETVAYMITCVFNLTPQEFIKQFSCEKYNGPF